MVTKKGGWYKEPRRHGLAAKGIKTAVDNPKEKAMMKNEMSERYVFYDDPAHAWLRVKRSELKKLGLLDKISPYSYMKGDYVYLEEDADATLFIEAKEKIGEKVDYDTITTDNESKIRRYESYSNKSENNKLMELDKEIKDRGLKFYSVIHGEGLDKNKSFIIERSQQARVLAKNEKDAEEQVKKAYGTDIAMTTQITDEDELIELKNKLLER